MKFQGSLSDLVQALHAVGRTVKTSSEKPSMYQVKTELGETVNLYKTGTLVVQGSPALRQKLTDQLIAYLARQHAPKLSRAKLPNEDQFGKRIFSDEWKQHIEKAVNHLCAESVVCDPLRSPSGLFYKNILHTLQDYLNVRDKLLGEDIIPMAILFSEAIIQRFDYQPYRSSFGSVSHFFLMKGNVAMSHPLESFVRLHHTRNTASLHAVVCELMVDSYLKSWDVNDITWDSAFERILNEEDYRFDIYLDRCVHFEKALIYQMSQDLDFFDLKRMDKVPESFLNGLVKYGEKTLKWKF